MAASNNLRGPATSSDLRGEKSRLVVRVVTNGPYHRALAGPGYRS